MKKSRKSKSIIFILFSLTFLLILNSCGLIVSKNKDGKNGSDNNEKNEVSKIDTEESTMIPEPEINDETEETEIETEEFKYPGNDINISGTIKSSDNTLIKLHIAWEAVQVKENQFADLKLTVFVDCYSIVISPRNNCVLIIDGEEIEFSSPKLENNKDNLSSLEIYSTKKQILNAADNASTVNVTAKFYFGGTYGGIAINWLEVSGEIVLFGESENNADNIEANPLIPELPDDYFEPIIIIN